MCYSFQPFSLAVSQKDLLLKADLQGVHMAETALAAIQRKQIEITIGELLLTDDHYMRLEITERLRHLIAHADRTLDKSRLSEGALEELKELNLLH